MAADWFDLTAERLEHHTRFDSLEARGTLRIALKAAGLESRNLTGVQLRVVFEKLIPGELDSRGIRNAGGAAENASATNPEDIFRRLAEG